MPTSSPEADPPGMALAILAEALYLANLLLLPGLAFGALLWLFWTRRPQAPDLAVNHLNQTVAASLWAGALLIAANLLIIALGGYQSANTWTVVIVYFTTCHASLVLLGMVGLSKAMSGQRWRFPIVGWRGAGP